MVQFLAGTDYLLGRTNRKEPYPPQITVIFPQKPGTPIGVPVLFYLAAAAVVIVAAPVIAAAIAAVVAAEGGAASAATVAQQQDQDHDPPPVVVQAATDTIVITAHKSTSRNLIGVLIPCSMVFLPAFFVQGNYSSRRASTRAVFPAVFSSLTLMTFAGHPATTVLGATSPTTMAPAATTAS